MSYKIIPLNNVTILDMPVDRVLNESKIELKDVILMGHDKNGEIYFASSYADGGKVLWLIELCKNKLLNT